MGSRYQADEAWEDKKRKIFRPGLNYFVGGNSKAYGAALLRVEGFGEILHGRSTTRISRRGMTPPKRCAKFTARLAGT